MVWVMTRSALTFDECVACLEGALRGKVFVVAEMRQEVEVLACAIRVSVADIAAYAGSASGEIASCSGECALYPGIADLYWHARPCGACPAFSKLCLQVKKRRDVNCCAVSAAQEADNAARLMRKLYIDTRRSLGKKIRRWLRKNCKELDA